MRNALLLLALLACGPEDVMAQQRIIPPAGPVGRNIGQRRDLSLGAGLANAAYQAPDVFTRAVPTTVPLGLATDPASLGVSPTADRAYIARIKNLDDDIDVATVAADAGTPAAGTAVAGVALYEVFPQGNAPGSNDRVAYTLRLLPGCEWFATVAAGSSIPGFQPTVPTRLQRSRSYAAAVVWSTAALLGGSGKVLNTLEPFGMRTRGAVTASTGFPASLQVDAGSSGPVALEYISFRVRIEPARPSTLYYDFY